MEWECVYIPKPIVQRIKKIMMSLGYANPSVFCQEATRVYLEQKQREYDELEGDRELGKKIRTGEE
jgi:hypothetical protein